MLDAVVEDRTLEEAHEYAAVSAELMASDGAAPPDIEPLGHVLLGEFSQAENERQDTENRWLKDLRQYRGQYDPETLAQIGVRSKAFVRKTRVKIKTVDSRVADLLFPAGGEKNWEIGPTPRPEITDQAKAEIMTALAQAFGGPDKIPRDKYDAAVLEVAKESARRMSNAIEDQLAEAAYKAVSVQAIHSCHLYGTGVIKGPLVERRVRTKFVYRVSEKDGKRVGKWVAASESYIVPFLECVPLWRFYPDMSATCIEDCRYVWERHSMPKHRLAALAKRKSFKGGAIRDHILANPDGSVQARHFDNEIKQIGDRSASQGQGKTGQYEVLERWGWLDGSQLRDVGVRVPDDRLHESFFSNIWILPNGCVIRAVLQPIDGVTWPYHLYYFDKDESSIFAEGIAAVMRDDQAQINAAVRLMLDNAAITAGPQIEVKVGLLTPGQKVDEIHPWKVWLRTREAPNEAAVRAIEMPSRLQELSALAQLFDANADEVTAIPRYMTGENATRGAAGTASGMSMLMGAANIVIKDLITSWDEGVTRRFLESLYRWNMRFSKDPAIKGDYEVKARGTSSLVAKEVRTRQLTEFAAMTNNPVDLPFTKRDVLLRQIAEAAELANVVKTEEEIKAEQENPQAQQVAQLQQQVMMLQLQEAQARIEKLGADAALIAARAKESEATMKRIIEQTVETRMKTIFAAMQAGSVATANPYSAPAGDEIYRSAGGKDLTPDVSLSDLNREPVQESEGTHQVLQKGARFEEQPQGDDVPVDNGRDEPTTVQPESAFVGANAGIETTRIEQ